MLGHQWRVTPLLAGIRVVCMYVLCIIYREITADTIGVILLTTTHISTEKLAAQKIKIFLRHWLIKTLFSLHFKALNFDKPI